MQVKRKLFHISKILVIIILIINIILVVLNYIRIGMFYRYDGIGVWLSIDNNIAFKQYVAFIESLYDDMIIQLIFLISIFVLFIILLITNNRQTNSTDRN